MAAPSQKKLSSYDPQVKKLLARMTLDEKIGQMTQPDQEFIRDRSEVEKLFSVGAEWRESDPKAGNSLEAWTDLYDDFNRMR